MVTQNEAIEIGKLCRNAKEGNLTVGSFAAELIGESYPFSKSMWDIVFKNYTDEKLGKKFIEWCK